MSIFRDYAQYYDLLYQEKDYESETNFIKQLISSHSSHVRSILELGSGTGRHAKLLAQKGFKVHGVECSTEMLAQCHSRYNRLPSALKESLSFTQGDLRTCDISQSFDAVISLFHVISYQVENEDLIAAFRTARKHLKPGGIFIFDVWYGPAVLHTPPEVRIKRLENENYKLIRVAEPEVHANENIVEVKYQVLVQENGSAHWDCFYETHHMRYLFNPELTLMLHLADFDLIETCEWLTNQKISANTWGACFIAQAR
jgi:SAM-dependent methyltransferase